MSDTSNSPNGFSGDAFSNNLFTDLAPLLSLFGDTVTVQYLSMAMGWKDCFLLSIGPLGVITMVISAIRVGQNRQLKALVGRYLEDTSEKPEIVLILNVGRERLEPM